MPSSHKLMKLLNCFHFGGLVSCSMQTQPPLFLEISWVHYFIRLYNNKHNRYIFFLIILCLWVCAFICYKHNSLIFDTSSLMDSVWDLVQQCSVVCVLCGAHARPQWIRIGTRIQWICFQYRVESLFSTCFLYCPIFLMQCLIRFVCCMLMPYNVGNRMWVDVLGFTVIKGVLLDKTLR